MNDAQMITAIEAQFLMGHQAPQCCMTDDRTAVSYYAWDMDMVRQQLNVPRDILWMQHMLDIYVEGCLHFSVDCSPETVPQWRDQPWADFGDVSISPEGVLRLATLYGRPYVRFSQASETLASHFQLVIRESHARLRYPHDEARWQEEWPERAMLSLGRMAFLLKHGRSD